VQCGGVIRSGIRGPPSTKELLTGHPFTEELGDSVGGSPAHLLADLRSGLIEKSVSNFKFVVIV
jgi:hypothetical protein